jgi:hypothetical protein
MEYFFVGPRQLLREDGLKELQAMPWLDHSTARFCLVPKTYTTPRGICIEPKEIQYLQQGQLSYMVNKLESNFWTRGQINFRSQEINRQLALQSSASQVYCTIDLSDASDRVSIQLVKDLLINDDRLLAQLEATRSSHVLLPNGVTVKLRKFSPMGSAVCFPLESLAFWCVSLAAISMEANVGWQQATSWVFVYGDDIIVPNQYFHAVVRALESIDMKVNVDKSYANGYFRESCGLHAYKGLEITPLRFKKPIPKVKTDGNAIKAWISYAHTAEEKGLSGVADLIYGHIESLVGVLPYGTRESGWICRLCSDPSLAYWLNSHSPIKRRWNPHLQQMEFRVPYLSSRHRDVGFIDGWKHLLSNLLNWNPQEDPSRVVVVNSTRLRHGFKSIW